MFLLDGSGVGRVGDVTPTRRPSPPRVEALAGLAEPLTHELDREVGLLSLDEAEHPHRVGTFFAARKAASASSRSFSVRSTRFSARNRRSSGLSIVVRPRRLPASIAVWATQYVIDCAGGSNSRASSDGDRLYSRTNRTNSVLYSDLYGERVRPAMADSPLDLPLGPRIEVSTNPGQLHPDQWPGIGSNRTRRSQCWMPSSPSHSIPPLRR